MYSGTKDEIRLDEETMTEKYSSAKVAFPFLDLFEESRIHLEGPSQRMTHDAGAEIGDLFTPPANPKRRSPS